MNFEVQKLIRRLVIFSVPWVLFAVFIIIVDPFQFFPTPSPVSEKLKEEISFKTNYAMWKMFEFRREPQSGILLGDSRMMSLDSAVIKKVSGIDFFNFAYGGGSLREAIDTFWFATETTDLENVVFGINLNLFNENDQKNRVAEVTSCLSNPLLYLVNRNVVTAAGRLTTASLTGQSTSIGKPIGNKDDFWKKQLNVTTRAYYANFRYPDKYLEELASVSEYCTEQGIDLSFVIFPSHQDLQDQVAVYDLKAEEVSMIADLAALSRVYNFELRNSLTEQRGNYRDPYHFTDPIMEIIIAGVWGQDRRFVQVIDPNSLQDP